MAEFFISAQANAEKMLILEEKAEEKNGPKVTGTL